MNPSFTGTQVAWSKGEETGSPTRSHIRTRGDKIEVCFRGIISPNLLVGGKVKREKILKSHYTACPPNSFLFLIIPSSLLLPLPLSLPHPPYFRFRYCQVKEKQLFMEASNSGVTNTQEKCQLSQCLCLCQWQTPLIDHDTPGQALSQTQNPSQQNAAGSGPSQSWCLPHTNAPHWEGTLWVLCSPQVPAGMAEYFVMLKFRRCLAFFQGALCQTKLQGFRQ